MTTFTIDIPDNNKDEVMAQLKKPGVKIRRSNLAKLDKLTKEDYEKHFKHQSKISRNSVLKISMNIRQRDII
jgi:hypothetical protein